MVTGRARYADKFVIYSMKVKIVIYVFSAKIMNEYPDSLDIPSLEKAINDFYSSEFEDCPMIALF